MMTQMNVFIALSSLWQSTTVDSSRSAAVPQLDETAFSDLRLTHLDLSSTSNGVYPGGNWAFRNLSRCCYEPISVDVMKLMKKFLKLCLFLIVVV